MDPVTGLSRRAALGLLAAVVVGVVASIVAQYVTAGVKAGCPDPRYGCATVERGEPIQIGALFPADVDGRRGIERMVSHGARPFGHPLRIFARDGRCSARAATAAARDFATDPPDGPPVVAVVGDACPAAEIPVAQILSDSGITFVSPAPAEVPGGAAFYLTGPTGAIPGDPGGGGLGGIQHNAFEASRSIVGAIQLVGVVRDGDLLIPRTQLRDALLASGLLRPTSPAETGTG